MTRDELGAAVTARRRFRHLASAFDASDTLLKPLAWQGDMSFGPSRDGRATFQRLDTNPRWTGLPDLDQAWQQAVETYFRTYGPATFRHVHYWLGEGLGVGRIRHPLRHSTNLTARSHCYRVRPAFKRHVRTLRKEASGIDEISSSRGTLSATVATARPTTDSGTRR